MANLNRVILIGRLTKDSETRVLNTGTPVTKFSMAVNRRKKQGDQWIEEANFFDVVAWGRLGEALQQYLIKGKEVAIDGELRQNRWEHEGQTRSKIEVIANAIQLLGSNNGNSSSQSQNNNYQEPKNNEPMNYDDDIPF